MTETKWLRRALLGGVALSVTATAAQAGELEALKAQLEALQSRVNQLETEPAPAPQLPSGTSLLTFERGAGSNTDWGHESKAFESDLASAQTRGFTIGVTPTADLPVPVAEITVYGYVKGDVIYDTEDDLFTRSVSGLGTALPSAGDNDHITLHANQSRFGIRSEVDTSIGQIRTRIEGDFEGQPYGTNDAFRLRHAFGEWHFAPNWRLLVGQTWFIAALLPIGISTVDFAGTLWTYSRNDQISLHYRSGPFAFGFGIERPTFNTNTNLPNFGAYAQYDVPGGHQFIVTGEVADWDSPALVDDGDLGWVVQAGANINLVDVATLTGAVVYGEGLHRKYCLAGNLAQPVVNSSRDPFEAFCTLAGITYAVSETASINAAWSYGDAIDSHAGLPAVIAGGTFSDDYHSVHANILWQPIKQMRMGWEVIYVTLDSNRGGRVDNVRGQFATWFFF